MKKIKLFLASSAELKPDREKFELEIYRKCKAWYDKGIFLHLDIWEDLSARMSLTGSQAEYNKFVEAADVMVADVDLRHRAPAGLPHHFHATFRLQVDADPVDGRDALARKQPLRMDAIGTGRGRVHRHQRHRVLGSRHFTTGRPASFHARKPPVSW